MRAGRWGDRAVPPAYIPGHWIDRQPVNLDAVKRKLEAEGVFGTLVGGEVEKPTIWPGVVKALALALMAGALFLLIR